LDTVLGSILAQPNDPTIETTPQGTSICGLPAFERENPQIQDEANEPARQDQKPLENMPRLHTEDKIREILAMVSRIPEHEIETGMSIYHIGLDSISAIKVSSLLRKQGVTLSVGEMLKAGTVENMALIAEQHNHTVPEVKVNAEVAIREALHGLDQADLIKRSGTDVPNIEQILPVSGGQLYTEGLYCPPYHPGFLADYGRNPSYPSNHVRYHKKPEYSVCTDCAAGGAEFSDKFDRDEGGREDVVS
jgi:aryl carrier-like protein